MINIHSFLVCSKHIEISKERVKKQIPTFGVKEGIRFLRVFAASRTRCKGSAKVLAKFPLLNHTAVSVKSCTQNYTKLQKKS